MQTGEDIQGMRKVTDLSRWVSVLLLLLHFYYYCYGAFAGWKVTSALSDRVLESIARTGMFHHLYTSKLIALIFLVLSFLGVRGRKESQFSVTGGCAIIAFGMILYFGSYLLLSNTPDMLTVALTYMGVTFTGYLAVLTGGAH